MPKSTLNLLIASHNNLRAQTIKITLESPAVNIQIVDSTDCLIEACRTHHIDLIIFLVISPYFTSMNIIEHLKQHLSQPPKTYVIAHSHSQKTILTLLECGVTQYMTFPLNLYRLRNKVFSLLEVEPILD